MFTAEPGEGEASSSMFVGAAAAPSIAAPVQGIFFLPPSLPPASLPGRPAEYPRPTRSHIPTLLARPTQPQGNLSPGCSGGRPGQARPRAGGAGAGGDAGKTVSEAGESWAGTGRLRPLGPQRPRCARPPAPQACPPRRRKRRRLGSAHAQFKLSPRPPPLPSPRPPRPGPAASLARRSPL